MVSNDKNREENLIWVLVRGVGEKFLIGKNNPQPLDENTKENLISIMDENLIWVLVKGVGVDFSYKKFLSHPPDENPNEILIRGVVKIKI